jgi:hypothetical protein
MSLCPECAKSRDAVRRTMARTLAAFFIGVVVLAILGWIVRAR